MAPNGEAAMSVVLNDLLLFSCLTALVTGVVIAAATLLIVSRSASRGLRSLMLSGPLNQQSGHAQR